MFQGKPKFPTQEAYSGPLIDNQCISSSINFHNIYMSIPGRIVSFIYSLSLHTLCNIHPDGCILSYHSVDAYSLELYG